MLCRMWKNHRGQQVSRQWQPSVYRYQNVQLQGHVACCGTVAMPCDLGWWILGRCLSCRGLVLCSWARHFTCMCTLLTQTWMGNWLDSDCLHVWILSSAMITAGLYAPPLPGSWAGTKANRSHKQGKTSQSNYYSAIGCQVVLLSSNDKMYMCDRFFGLDFATYLATLWHQESAQTFLLSKQTRHAAYGLK